MNLNIKALRNRIYDDHNIEKCLSFWYKIFDNKKGLKFFSDKIKIIGDENYLTDTFGFYGFYGLIFKVLFSKKTDLNSKYENQEKYSMILIIINFLISFQKNWNQEVNQNIDFFPENVVLEFFNNKKYYTKERCGKIFDLIWNPYLYIIGIDIKAVQTKIICINKNKTLLKKRSFNFRENSSDLAFINSIKASFFMDYGEYLQLIDFKNKNSNPKSKTNFSDLSIRHFLLLKVLNFKKKKLNMKILKTKLIFFFFFPKKQTYMLGKLVTIRRKKV